MFKVLDLFSGIGGFSLGLERTGGFKTVAFCEIDPYCRKVLAKHWPGVPIYDDVRKLEFEGPADVVCGGFPCQPFSSASRGRRSGTEDDRYLWPKMLATIEAIGPAWVIGENVDEFADLAFDRVCSDLGDRGYATWAAIIPALAVDAPHTRERLWFVGYSDAKRQPARSLNDETPRLSGMGSHFEWPAYTSSLGMGDGLPGELDRLRCLGNAVVPQIPELIGRAILKASM